MDITYRLGSTRLVYETARAFGRGRVVSGFLAACMLVSGHAPKHRVRSMPAEPKPLGVIAEEKFLRGELCDFCDSPSTEPVALVSGGTGMRCNACGSEYITFAQAMRNDSISLNRSRN